MGSASGINDSALFRRTECPAEAGQRGLDEPRFEGHACSLAVEIEFPSNSQRLKRRCDAPGRHAHHHDLVADYVMSTDFLSIDVPKLPDALCGEVPTDKVSAEMESVAA
jgi:hypothetical protein